MNLNEFPRKRYIPSSAVVGWMPFCAVYSWTATKVISIFNVMYYNFANSSIRTISRLWSRKSKIFNMHLICKYSSAALAVNYWKVRRIRNTSNFRRYRGQGRKKMLRAESEREREIPRRLGRYTIGISLTLLWMVISGIPGPAHVRT